MRYVVFALIFLAAGLVSRAETAETAGESAPVLPRTGAVSKPPDESSTPPETPAPETSESAPAPGPDTSETPSPDTPSTAGSVISDPALTTTPALPMASPIPPQMFLVLDEAAASRILEELARPGATVSDWRDAFRAYFAQNRFGEAEVFFWSNLISASGLQQTAVAQLSGVFAAAGAAAALHAAPPDFDALAGALRWLDSIADRLAPEHKNTVTEGVRGAMSDAPPDLTGMLRVFPGSDPAIARLGMQTALTLARFAGSADLKAWLQLPLTTQVFFENAHVLLFDNGALDPAQLESLASLFRAVSPALHGVTALVVPEGMGIDASQAGLMSPGVILNIASIPMDIASNPAEFIPRLGVVSAPEFTLAAATQLLRAVQFTQGRQRPELFQRRNFILNNAAAFQERYLRRSIEPGIYFANPDELIPLTGYLWFLDSERAFYMALDLLQLGQHPPMDTLLLLADMLSGGHSETLIFQIGPDGTVNSKAVPLRRRPMGPGLYLVSGLNLAGVRWGFDFNEAGILYRFYQD